MKRAQGGFTLIELVLAMVLLGAMMVLLYGGLTFGLRAWDASDANGRRVGDRRIGENFLRREIGETFPMRWKDPTTLRYAFQGGEHELRFVSARPAGIGQGGLALVGLAVEDDPHHPGQRNLAMRRVLADPDAADFSALDGAQPSIVVVDVASVDISYFGSENDYTDPSWSQEWIYPARMPELIRLKMVGSDGAPLPDMTMRIMLGEEAGCMESALQHGCRPRRS